LSQPHPPAGPRSTLRTPALAPRIAPLGRLLRDTLALRPLLALALARPRLAATLLAVGLLWLVGYPLLFVAREAVTDAGTPTAAHLLAFATRADEWLALGRSLWISLASVGLAAAVGVPLAFVFERAEFPGRRLLGVLVSLPVALPPLVGVIAFLFLYGESGFLARALGALLGPGSGAPRWQLTGAPAILLVHAYSMYVYFYLFVRAGLRGLDAAHEEAAAALGVGPLATLRRVVLPQLYPALAAASLLTFMTALGSFSAPYVFGGGYRVMTTQIVASKLNGETAMAHVETVALALLAVVALGGMRHLESRVRLAKGTVRGVAPARRRIRSGWLRRLVTLLAWGLATVLLLPHATLLLISLVPPATWTTEALPPVLSLVNYQTLLAESERLRPIVASLALSATATLLALVLGLWTAVLGERVRGRLGALLEATLALPWAIPGTVFAVALATTMSVDRPWAGRFLLVGTAGILVLAYLVRSLPLTGRAALAGVRGLDPALSEAAAALGAGPGRTLSAVVLPLVWPSVAAGAGLALITNLGDFVTSIVLYTYETRPIAVEIYSSLRVQELGIAAALGVLLMLASAAGFLAWDQSLRDRPRAR
jgi:iron(III) transport system permease protein